MKLKIVGSSSSGNCCLLENNSECLVIEAGMKYSDVQKALNYDVSKVSGCVVTHEHGDHAKYIRELLKASIDVYASCGTWEAVGLTSHRCHEIESYKQVQIGGFKVIPFKVEHDAKEPLGFLIKHKEMGTLLFATDTYYLKDRFSGLNHVLIECNYSMDILNENVISGRVNDSVRNRVIRSHMEIETCKEFLATNDLSEVNTIVLLHLSSQNGNGKVFVDEIERLTGKITMAAKKGLEIELGRELI